MIKGKGGQFILEADKRDKGRSKVEKFESQQTQTRVSTKGAENKGRIFATLKWWTQEDLTKDGTQGTKGQKNQRQKEAFLSAQLYDKVGLGYIEFEMTLEIS